MSQKLKLREFDLVRKVSKGFLGLQLEAFMRQDQENSSGDGDEQAEKPCG